MCVAAGGELDLSSAGELRALLARALADGGRVVLDLSALEFMDSTGLAVIVRAINSVRGSGSGLALYAELRSQPQRLMELTGVLQSLPLLDVLPSRPPAPAGRAHGADGPGSLGGEDRDRNAADPRAPRGA